MEALLSAMSGLAVDGAFPCMPYVAYASMKHIDFVRHVPEQGEVVIESQSWVLPDFTLADFYTVPKDFLAAAFVFLGSIPQCKQSVLSLQSVPSTTDLQRSMAPDRHAVFLTKLAAWLASGRSTVRYTDLSQWDRMALSVPFWKDPDFCQQEMDFVDTNVNMVPHGNHQCLNHETYNAHQRQNKET